MGILDFDDEAFNRKYARKKRRKFRAKVRSVKKEKHQRFVTPKYKTYIKSRAWAKRKRQYYQNHPKRCVACRSKSRVGIHHLNYRNVWREKDEDLIVLCWACHAKYHQEHGVHQDNEQNTYSFVDDTIQNEWFYPIAKNL